MKTPSNDLYDLIFSLNTLEKKTFTLNAKRYKISTKTLLLYKAICLNTINNNEVILCKKLNISKTELKHLKLYLYKTILKSLETNSITSEKKLKILSLINQANILINKNLYTQANKILNSAKEICLKNENFDYLLVINSIESSIIMNTPGVKNNIILLEGINDSFNSNLNNFILISGYEKLKNEILLLSYQYKYAYNDAILKKVETYFNHKLIKNKPTVKSREINTRYNYINYILFTIIDYPAKAEYHLKNVINFISEVRDEKPIEYLTFCHEYTKSLITNSNFTELEKTCIKATDFINKLNDTDKNEAIVRLKCSFLKAGINGKYIQTNDDIKYLNDIHNLKINGYFINLKIEDQVEIQFQIIKIHFSLNNYKLVLKELNNYEAHYFNTEILEDFKEHFEIIKILTHYELKNYDIINSITRSHSRNFAKNSSYFNLIISFFKNEKYFFSNKLSTKEKFALAKREIDTFLLKNDNYIDERKYFDIKNWINKKLN